MRNPLRSEDAAFRLVLGSILYFAPIVLASWVAPWLGLVVFVVASAVVVVLVVRQRGGAAARDAAEPPARARVTDTPDCDPPD